jgi:hypothetical protein
VLDDKVKTLRTLINRYVFEAQERDRLDKICLGVRKYVEHRNVIAHSAFRPSETSDGVEFFAWTANKELKSITMDWPVKQFHDAVDAINKLDNDLRSMESAASIIALARALQKRQASDIASLFAYPPPPLTEDEEPTE